MTDITEPTSEHASLILRGLWPSASESAWREFAHECLALAAQLTGENDAQTYVATVLGESAGDLIDSLQKLLTTSTSTLAQRINCYRGASGSAEVIAAQIYAAKVEMTEAVDNAERLITAAREELKPKIEAAQAAGLAAVAGGYTAELLARTQAALASAQAEVATTSATAVASIETAAAALPSPAAMPSPHAGSTSPPATTPNAIPADYVAQPAKYGTNLDGDARQSPERGTGEHRNALNDPNSQGHQDRPRLADTAPESKPYTPSTVGSGSSAGGSPSSASGSPGGGLGSMMKPLSPAASSVGSPASAGSPASGAGAGSTAGGRPTGAPAAGSSGGPVPQSPVPVGAPATPSRVSGTGLGSGVAESAGRLGGGAINAAAAAAAGVPGAAAHAVTTAASSTAPSIPGGGGGGPAGGGVPAVPPMIAPAPAPAPPAAPAPGPVVGPAPAGGPGPVSSTTPASNTPTSAPSTTAAGQASQHDSGPEFLPVILPMSPLTGLDQSASPQVILERATEAGRSIITTMIAQTRATGYLGIDWAASIIWERTGEISAWLASSEGPSYIPLGLRVPDGVALAVSAWAAATGARPVAVAASLADPEQFDGGQHRCQAAMPWEWNQAQSLAESERMRIAERHMLMAITAGHLNDPIYEDVSRLFQLQKPISDSIWAGLQQQWNDAIVAYQLEQQNAGLGGADPLRQFITARAAELMLCLQHADTADGCADILYLARLAGIPYQSTPGVSCSP